MNEIPSADIVQFAIDLRHVVETARSLGLKPTVDEAFHVVLEVRRTEAGMRGMVQQGNVFARLVDQGRVEPG